jgi:hypothetical protein
MADVFGITEANGAGETLTNSISNTNWGSNDSANLNTTTYPITPATNSYVKYHKFHWVTKDVYTQISNIKVYKSSGTLSGSDVLYAVADATFATPVATTLTGGGAIPTSSGSALAITGTLTAQDQRSSYLAHQMQVDAATVIGASSIVITWQYDAQG